MSLIKRLGIIAACTLSYWGASMLFPDVNSPSVLKALSGLFGFILTLEVIAFRQLSTATGTGVLKGSEIERLNMKRAEIRRRIYLTSALIIACTVTLFVLGIVVGSHSEYEWIPFAVGLLIGIGINYIAVIVSWINQLSAFADGLRQREQQQKDFADQLKRLSDAAKAG